MLVLIVGVVSVVVGWAVTKLMRRYALANAVLDVPNDRSSHETPTPRGGGVGVVLPVVLVLAAIPSAMLGVGAGMLGAAAILIVAAIGWLDDHRPLGVRSRLVGHVAAGVLVALFAGSATVQPFPVAMPVVVAGLWWIFWTVSSINVVNFIDGIDGIIGLQAVVFGLFAVAGAEGQTSPSALMGVTLAGAALGFLVLNWSPASIFMGDVGSGSLGVAFVLLGVLTMAETNWTVVHAFLPLMPIFADEVLTMCRRVARGESLSEPHRTHVYQLLVQAGFGHSFVAILYGILATFAATWAIVVPDSNLTFWIGSAIGLVFTFLLLSFLRNWAEVRTAVGGSRGKAHILP